MPKSPPRNNPRHTKSLQVPAKPSSGPNKINDLMTRSRFTQRGIDTYIKQQDFWFVFFKSHLAPDLHAQITHSVEKNTSLTVFTTTPAWAARLKFALAEQLKEAQIARPQLLKWTVRVQPAAAKTGERT